MTCVTVHWCQYTYIGGIYCLLFQGREDEDLDNWFFQTVSTKLRDFLFRKTVILALINVCAFDGNR